MLKNKIVIILFSVCVIFYSGCQTKQNYVHDAEIQKRRAEEAKTIDAMKKIIIKPSAVPETEVGRIKSEK